MSCECGRSAAVAEGAAAISNDGKWMHYRIVEPSDRVWNIVLGLLGIVAGAIILAQPGVGLITLVWIVSLTPIVRGIVEIAAGLQIRKLHKAGVV